VWPERFGNYFVVRKIASGGMADVYLCRLRGAEGFEKTAAVKVIPGRLSASPRFRDLFVREARIAAALSHPNLVQVFDFGRAGESLFLAMEFVPGWNLAQVAARIRSLSAPPPLEIWRAWTEGMVEGLGYLHSRKVVHRDVSPGNVLLSRSGIVKIADFGIARPGEEREGNRTGWEGKVSYLSPEQAGGKPATFRSDLFSAAVVSAELFLPGRLFEGTDEEEILSRIRSHSIGNLPSGRFPPEVDGLLRKALHPLPEERYPDAGSFSRAIAEAVPGAPARAGIVAFFDSLFPEDPGDEETVVEEAGPSGMGGGLVRERREEYRSGRGRLLGVGIATGVVAAVSLGTFLLTRTSMERTPDPSVPRESVSAASVTPSSVPVSAKQSPAAGTARVGRPAGSVHGASIRREDPAPPPPVPAPAPRSPLPGQTSAESPEALFLVTVPSGAAVLRDDGTHLGNTPLRIERRNRTGDGVLLRHPGYRDQRIPFSALSGRSEFRVEMEPRTGTIPVLQAIPWARVYEGERLLGVTPIVSLRLPVGEHTLRFVNEALGVDRAETLEIREGENGKVVVPLVRRGEKEPRY